jgi:nucleoside-diphosphate-sugar epimerase
VTRRLFIFGLGYSGLEIARLARADGWQVGGTVVGAAKAARLRADGVDAHQFDGTAPLPAPILAAASHVLCTIAPGVGSEGALKACGELSPGVRWLGYLSTTGVYGDRAGGWVDETTEPRPAQPRSIERLEAERAWQALGQRLDATVNVFRLPGIYGPGRSAVDQVKAGTARRIDKPGQVFSRIHIDDIAATVAAALDREMSPGAIFNVADDLPASSSELIEYACVLLGRPVPPAVPWAEAERTMSAMARSFYAECRRVTNDRIKRELGVVLRYPTYREGLRAIARSS